MSNPKFIVLTDDFEESGLFDTEAAAIKSAQEQVVNDEPYTPERFYVVKVIGHSEKEKKPAPFTKYTTTAKKKSGGRR